MSHIVVIASVLFYVGLPGLMLVVVFAWGYYKGRRHERWVQMQRDLEQARRPVRA